MNQVPRVFAVQYRSHPRQKVQDSPGDGAISKTGHDEDGDPGANRRHQDIARIEIGGMKDRIEGGDQLQSDQEKYDDDQRMQHRDADSRRKGIL